MQRKKCSGACMGHFEGGHHYLHYLHHSLASGQITQEGTQARPSTENWIKDLLSILLERKVMTNLDSILKSRDTTLPTKVRRVKAMVFPVVMYGCESWTIKKAEL